MPVIDPETGKAVQVQVVEPGSADDPFRPGGAAASQPNPQGSGVETAQQAVDGQSGQVATPAAPGTQPAPTPAVGPDAQPQTIAVTRQAPMVQKTAQSSQAPATQTVEPVQEPAQQPAQTAPAPVPTTQEGVADLARWNEEQVEGARREQQGNYDRRADQLTRQFQNDLAGAQEQTAQLRAQVREIQVQGLSDDERATVMARLDQEDRSDELQTWENELNSYHKGLMALSLETENADFGVNADDLMQFETPEEMEAFCLEQKATALDQRVAALTNGAAPATTQPAQQPAPVVAQAPAQPAQPSQVVAPAYEPPAGFVLVRETPQAEPQIPAGAVAPSDTGGGGTPPNPNELSKELGSEALKGNLGKMGWESIRLPGQ